MHMTLGTWNGNDTVCEIPGSKVKGGVVNTID
jgi:hypothetical protein